MIPPKIEENVKAMPISPSPLLDTILDFLPVSMIAGVVWVCHTIVTRRDDVQVSYKYLLSGYLLSTFVGWTMFVVFKSMNMPVDLAFVMGMVIGTTGVQGYNFLATKAHQMAGGSNEENH